MRLLQITLTRQAHELLADILTGIESERMLPGIENSEAVFLQIIVRASNAEPLMDQIEKRLGKQHKFTMLLLPISATIPRLPEADEQDEDKEEVKQLSDKGANRVSREELYSNINAGINNLQYYVAMVVIACVVAAIGLIRNDIAIIIAAMVIAPLLGPNMALSLATTLADKELAKVAAWLSLLGATISIIIAAAIGYFVEIDPSVSAISARTTLGVSDLILALASGVAGALAFTAGAPATLIGVMVAVALMPPLVTSGMLFGSGYWSLASNALWLTLANVICVNLAGVATFVWQGVRPLSWWEKSKAKKASRNAAVIWIVLFTILLALINFNFIGA